MPHSATHIHTTQSGHPLRYHKPTVAPKAQVIHLATPSAAYDITLGQGLLRTLHPRLDKLMGGKPFRPFLITSPNIWKLWSTEVSASFPQDARSDHPFPSRPVKSTSVLPPWKSLAEQLARSGADRDALLIAFGGGVIGDITGFLAAIYMRGVPFIQIPTTFLAQVDSSVGGKTGVNLTAGKNLVGSFNQPRAVLVDIDLLTTLPAPELRAGLQESIKAAIIQKVKLFSFLELNKELAVSGDGPTLLRVIASSIKVKASVVAQDEKERPGGPRMTLNFGHTIGHAIEAATDYKRLLHGEAVAWGSIAALHLGLNRRSINPAQFSRMANLILAYGPLPGFRATAPQLVALARSDKKNRSGRRAFILPTGIGSTQVVFDVSDDELEAATRSMLDDMRAATRYRGKEPA